MSRKRQISAATAIRLLLVEDNEHDRRAVERTLKKSNLKFDLTARRKAEEAELLLSDGASRFDLVIVDHNLPGPSGLDLFLNLKAKTEPPPFVMMTGVGSEQLAVAAIQAGMYDYIVKDPNQQYLHLLPLVLLQVYRRYVEFLERQSAKERQKKRLKKLHILHLLTVQLLGETMHEGLLQQLVDAACELSDANIGTSGHGFDKKALRGNAAGHSRPDSSCPPGGSLRIEKGGVYQDVIENGKAMRLTDAELQAHPRWWGLPAGHVELRGLLCVPLMGRDQRVIEMIMVSDKKQGDFSEEDEALLSQLAAIGSLAMRHIDARDRIEVERSSLKTIIDAAPVAIVVTDALDRIVSMNEEAEKLFGQPLPVGRKIFSRKIMPLRRPNGRYYATEDLPLTRAALHGEVVTDMEVKMVLQGEGSRSFLVNASPIGNKDEGLLGAVGIFRDITDMAQKQEEILESHDELEELVDLRTDELRSTVQLLESEIEERKQAEQDLLRSRYELRMLTQKTLETLETDRQSVAKELHDSIGASLAAIKFGLEQKLAAMKAGMGNEEISIEKMIDHLVDTIKETKRISANLRPSTLDDLGLIATINWFCRDFGSFYPHLQVIEELNCREEQISENLKIVIYRILQEAMNNAAKHSDADIIRLNLNMADGNIILKVEDNGVGFAVDQQDIRKDPLSGYGIQGMRERAEICGGSFEVASQAGAGTTIEVRLPLRAEGI